MYNTFSQSLMKKYGWNEGEGLGKKNQGITQPIKATLKFNSHGLAYKEIDTDQESKWSNMFSSAVSNLQVENDNRITVIKDNTKEEKLNLSGVKVLYKSFLKSTAILKDGIEVKPKKIKRKLDDLEISNDSKKKFKTPNKTDLDFGTADKIKKKKKCKTYTDESKVLESINAENSDCNKVNLQESCVVNKSKKKKCKTSTDPVVYSENQTQVICSNVVSQDFDKNCKTKKSKKYNEIEIKSNKDVHSYKKKTKSDKNIKDLSTLSTPDIETPNSLKRDKKKKKVKNDTFNEVQSSNHKKIKSEKIVEDLKQKQSIIVPESTSMTCHTSARCGITMTGKLARIQKLYEEEKLKSLSIKSFF